MSSYEGNIRETIFLQKETSSSNKKDSKIQLARNQYFSLYEGKIILKKKRLCILFQIIKRNVT